MKEKKSERFIKLKDNDLSRWLVETQPHAFRLLTIIALRARRTFGHPDGIEVGCAKIGDWNALKMTRQQYRTALSTLCGIATIKIIETNRNRKKSTTGTTTEGTLVKLLNSDIWDINPETDNHRPNHCPTTDQPLPNHEQECKNVKNAKEQQPQTPCVVFFCLKEIETLNQDEKEQLSQKFSEERVSLAVDFFRYVPHKEAPIAGYLWHCRQESPPLPPARTLPPAEKLTRNRDIANAFLSRCKQNTNVQFDVLNKSAEIIFLGCQKQPICFDFEAFDPEKMRSEIERELIKCALI